MGIRGLKTYIKTKISHAWKSCTLSTHRGERWGIDISCLLFRARAAQICPVTTIACILQQLRTAGIEPIVIFDGRPPTTKASVIEERRTTRDGIKRDIERLEAKLLDPEISIAEKLETTGRIAELRSQAPQITRSDKDEIKQLLYAAGILRINADGEADDVLGLLARQGHIQAVISTDMDMLARGVPVLVVPETVDGTVFSEIRLSTILSYSRITEEEFTKICVVLGSDYSVGVVRSFYDAIHYIRRTTPTPEMTQAFHLLRGTDVTWESLVSEKQRELWAAGVPAKEPDVLETFAKEKGWPQSWVSDLLK